MAVDQVQSSRDVAEPPNLRLNCGSPLMRSNEMDVSPANRKLLIELVIGTVTFLEESG